MEHFSKMADDENDTVHAYSISGKSGIGRVGGDRVPRTLYFPADIAVRGVNGRDVLDFSQTAQIYGAISALEEGDASRFVLATVNPSFFI